MSTIRARRACKVKRAGSSETQRGQAAAEFMAYAAFFLMFFTLSTAYFVDQQTGEVRNRELQFAKEAGSQYADYVNFAVAAGDGFQGRFTVPTNILGRTYDARFGSDGFVYVNWTDNVGDFYYAYPLNTKNVTMAAGAPPAYMKITTPPGGSITYVDITETRGAMTLINNGGQIFINQS